MFDDYMLDDLACTSRSLRRDLLDVLQAGVEVVKEVVEAGKIETKEPTFIDAKCTEVVDVRSHELISDRLLEVRRHGQGDFQGLDQSIFDFPGDGFQLV